MGSLSKFFAENIDLLVDAFDLDANGNLVEKKRSRVAEADKRVHDLFVTEMRGILKEFLPPRHSAEDEDEIHGYRRPRGLGFNGINPNDLSNQTLMQPQQQAPAQGTPQAGPQNAGNRVPARAPEPQAPAAQGDQPTGDGIPSRLSLGPRTGSLNPLLVQTLHAASTYLPDGYRVSVTSGERPGAHVHGGGGTSQHSGGNAMDVQIIGPDGTVLPNRGEDTSGMYGRLARAAYHELSTTNPEAAKNLRWGGNFETGVGSGVKDIMHYDLGGDKLPQGRFGNLSQQYQQNAKTDNFRPAGQPVLMAQSQKPAQPGQQAIDYKPGDFAKSLGVTPDQYNAFRNGIGRIENARYDQMGGSSGRFAGRYQMGGSEIAQTAKQLGEPTPSTKQFLSDPQMQERYFERYSLDHHNSLMNNPKYANASPEEKLQILGYAHNQGAGGASKWLTTGQAGRDAFGTSGTKYYDTIGSNLKQLAQNPQAAGQPSTQQAQSGPSTQERPQPQQMAAAGGRQSYLPIGDSLAYGVGGTMGNTRYAVSGSNPEKVMGLVNQAVQRGDVAGKHVILSGGASNAGGDVNSVNTYYPQMVQALKNAGASNVTIMGVGPYKNYDKYGYHGAIDKIARDNGVNYTGPLANIAPFSGSSVQQQVHPTDYKPILAHIQNSSSGPSTTQVAQSTPKPPPSQTPAPPPQQTAQVVPPPVTPKVQPPPQVAQADTPPPPASSGNTSGVTPSGSPTVLPTPTPGKLASADLPPSQKPTQIESRRRLAIQLLRS